MTTMDFFQDLALQGIAALAGLSIVFAVLLLVDAVQRRQRAKEERAWAELEARHALRWEEVRERQRREREKLEGGGTS